MNDTTRTEATVINELMRQDPLIRTVGDIFDIFAYMADESNEALAGHMSTLVGARTRGSTTVAGLNVLDSATAVRRAVDDGTIDNDCVAYEIPLSAQQMDLMRPALCVWPAGRCLDAGYAISRREGPHTDPNNPRGLELFLNQDEKHSIGQMLVIGQDDFITVLIGPDDIDPSGAHIVHTWYPGGSFTRYIPALGIQDDNAVKLHNGT